MADSKTVNDKARWQRHKAKHHPDNPVFRLMLKNFYNSLGKLIQNFDAEDKLLEVGCGIGITSMRIHQMLSGQHMEVSDVTPYFVQQLQESDFPLPVKQESVLNLQREDNSFDVVFLLEVLEHLEDYEQALRELFRVSRKYVVISVPNEPLWRILNMARGKYWSQWGNTPAHVNNWTATGIRRLLNQYGQVEKTYYPVPWSIVLARVSDEYSET